ncbi:MAG: hypothetical protein JSS53_00005 [Proteobacteria bacterium]|nr:hypothetical protein [Pseudomonadota bacterium]
MKKLGKSHLKEIHLGVQLAIARTLAQHKKTGRSIAIWKDDRVVHVPPEEIQYDEEILKKHDK